MEQLMVPFNVYEDSSGWIAKPAWAGFIQQTRDSWNAQIWNTGPWVDYQTHYHRCLANVSAQDRDTDSGVIHFKSEHHLTLFLIRYAECQHYTQQKKRTF
jgi:hypothetical protein